MGRILLEPGSILMVPGSDMFVSIPYGRNNIAYKQKTQKCSTLLHLNII